MQSASSIIHYSSFIPSCYARYSDLHRSLFPDSDIAGSKLVWQLPDAIDAYTVLLRPVFPRHPPFALLKQQFPPHLAIRLNWTIRSRLMARLLAGWIHLRIFRKRKIRMNQKIWPTLSCAQREKFSSIIFNSQFFWQNQILLCRTIYIECSMTKF